MIYKKKLPQEKFAHAWTHMPVVPAPNEWPCGTPLVSAGTRKGSICHPGHGREIMRFLQFGTCSVPAPHTQPVLRELEGLQGLHSQVGQK